ncbi:MAG: C39 family peptidase [Kofleriaceae bacterium]
MARGYHRISRGAIKVALPSVRQREDWTCGAAALLAVCAYYGVGPEWEHEVATRMRLTRAGSDPVQLVRAARAYGLETEEVRGMTDAQLRRTLDARRPVMMMLQAWGNRRGYADHWRAGHWVIAIGYMRAGVVFEDPWLHRSRGFLGWRELAARWHDVEGRDDHQVDRYGLVIWRAGARLSRREHLCKVLE